MKLTIDFETRSSGVDLRETNAWVYSADPACEVMCLAVIADDGWPQVWAPEHFRTLADSYADTQDQPRINWLSDADLTRYVSVATEIEAHNYGFELAVWTRIMHDRLGFPMIDPRKWRCTMARCARFALPHGLGDACSVLQLPVQKDTDGRKLMLKMTKPRRIAAEGVHWHETPADVYRLIQYCAQDVIAEKALSAVLPELDAFEEAVFQLDRSINTRGVWVDDETIRSLKALEEIICEDLEKEFIRLAGCRSSQRAGVLAALAGGGLALDELTKDSVRTALLRDDISPRARRILELRQILSRTSTAKLDAMLACACADQRVRGTYQYHGAHTGRWSGRTVQTQNLPRGTFEDTDTFIELAQAGDAHTIQMLYSDAIDGIVTCIRPMLSAAPGRVLAAADYSSIEGRALAWLAGEDQTLQNYREKKDMYKLAACTIYKCGYDEVTKAQRQIGKVAELALGYGGAEGAFLTMAAGYGVQMKDGDATMVKEAWREGRQATVKLWRELDKAAKSAIRTPGARFQYRGVAYQIVRMAGWPHPVLVCTLPSGRNLHYHNPTIQERVKPWGVCDQIVYWGTDSVTHRWTELETYGGKLTENVVQAICRDIQASAMLRLAKDGMSIVMHTHDEIVVETDYGQYAEKRLCEVMTEPIGWARGLPIEAAGWHGKRYRK